MTTDQTLTLLAIMVWPFVALVSCWSLYLTARLVVEARAEEGRRTREHQTRLATSIIGQLDQAHHGTAVYTKQFWSSVLQSTLPALVRGVVGDLSVMAEPSVPQTAERALLALIASNGGIPARRGEDTVRLLVHEVRKLYDELEHPTEPVRVEGDDGRDDDLVSELFGGGGGELDDDDGNRPGATAAMDEEI